MTSGKSTASVHFIDWILHELLRRDGLLAGSSYFYRRSKQGQVGCHAQQQGNLEDDHYLTLSWLVAWACVLAFRLPPRPRCFFVVADRRGGAVSGSAALLPLTDLDEDNRLISTAWRVRGSLLFSLLMASLVERHSFRRSSFSVSVTLRRSHLNMHIRCSAGMGSKEGNPGTVKCSDTIHSKYVQEISSFKLF
jgi:hypothetical protein